MNMEALSIPFSRRIFLRKQVNERRRDTPSGVTAGRGGNVCRAIVTYTPVARPFVYRGGGVKKTTVTK